LHESRVSSASCQRGFEIYPTLVLGMIGLRTVREATYCRYFESVYQRKHVEATVDSKRVIYVPDEKGVVFEENSSQERRDLCHRQTTGQSDKLGCYSSPIHIPPLEENVHHHHLSSASWGSQRSGTKASGGSKTRGFRWRVYTWQETEVLQLSPGIRNPSISIS
jgi:hypothetical protein